MSQARCQNNNNVGIISIGGEKQLEGTEDNLKRINPISYSEVAKRHSAPSPDSLKADSDSQVHKNVRKSKHFENDTEDSENSMNIMKRSDSDVFQNLEDNEKVQLSSTNVSDVCNLRTSQGSISIPRQRDSSHNEVQPSGQGAKDNLALSKHDQVASSTTKSSISFPYMQVSQNLNIDS